MLNELYTNLNLEDFIQTNYISIFLLIMILGYNMFFGYVFITNTYLENNQLNETGNSI